MARENQGLQIALIVFVMLTLILGVTTFVFFNQAKDADVKEKAAQRDASEKGQAAAAKATECNELKKMMGFPETQKADEITTQFNQDMTTFGGTFPAEVRFYHPLLAQLAKTLQQKSAELAEANDNLTKVRTELEVREATSVPQIKKFEDAAKQASDALAAADDTYKKERARITGDQTKLQEQLQETRKKAESDVTAVKTSLEVVTKENQELGQRYTRTKEELEGVRKETFDAPLGEVRFVNQHAKTVWIDLGRADGLGRQITFAVYPVDITNLAKATKKASIEVTQVLGEHLAEARVLEDTVSDPIMPGDKIFTPLWSPGERRHFALAGLMDLDEDGKSDQKLVADLIAMNNGIVDAQTDPNTFAVTGKMTERTRYLVLGEAPTVAAANAGAKAREGAAVDGYTRMINEATKLGVQKISLADLLQRMGWKNQVPVVQYGRGANPNNFRAKADEGVTKVSTGTVSGLFQPRRPPAAKSSTERSSAY